MKLISDNITLVFELDHSMAWIQYETGETFKYGKFKLPSRYSFL